MRVLHINAGNLYGGIEVLLVTLARFGSLCPGMESHFAVCFEGRFSSELRELGVPVEVAGGVRARAFWTVWRARRRFREILCRGGYDAVICHGAWIHSILGPAARNAGIRIVFWLHDPPHPRVNWLERWANTLEPDLMICNSRYTQEGSGDLFPGLPREIVYCPVASRQSGRVSPVDRSNARAEFDTPENAVVILQVSRLDPHKGHLMHLEALSRMKEVPGWVCWMVAGPQRPHEVELLEGLKKFAEESGIRDRVRFPGWQPDIGRLFGAADIFCQPNVGPEPFGITFVEALYAGLPVVTTALGGALEIVTPDCGILVSPEDAEGLAAALRKLIEDEALRNRLGQCGPERAAAICAPRPQIGKLYEILGQLSFSIAA
jgi:glycosyltransferase involved in cell wall biosynthesis